MWFLLPALAAPPDPDLLRLAADLTKVEADLRYPGLDESEIRAVGMRQQVLYRRLSGDEALTEAVLAELDPKTRWVVQTNIESGSSIAHTVTNLKTTVPAWSIAKPLGPDELIALYQEAEATHGVPWEVLAAINLCETRMGRLQGTSWAGAQGPMQFMPATWRAYGEGDVTDPHDAILGAGNYLSKMGASKDLDRAIWHYNHSDAYVRAIRGYASVIEQNPLAFRGYWAWQVFYRTTEGVVLLPEGYSESRPVDVVTWCAANAEHCPPRR